jgi:hypothetical protein
MDIFGILRCAQDDSKNKQRIARSRVFKILNVTWVMLDDTSARVVAFTSSS